MFSFVALIDALFQTLPLKGKIGKPRKSTLIKIHAPI